MVPVDDDEDDDEENWDDVPVFAETEIILNDKSKCTYQELFDLVLNAKVGLASQAFYIESQGTYFQLVRRQYGVVQRSVNGEKERTMPPVQGAPPNW